MHVNSTVSSTKSYSRDKVSLSNFVLKISAIKKILWRKTMHLLFKTSSAAWLLSSMTRPDDILHFLALLLSTVHFWSLSNFKHWSRELSWRRRRLLTVDARRRVRWWSSRAVFCTLNRWISSWRTIITCHWMTDVAIPLHDRTTGTKCHWTGPRRRWGGVRSTCPLEREAVGGVCCSWCCCCSCWCRSRGSKGSTSSSSTSPRAGSSNTGAPASPTRGDSSSPSSSTTAASASFSRGIRQGWTGVFASGIIQVFSFRFQAQRSLCVAWRYIDWQITRSQRH